MKDITNTIQSIRETYYAYQCFRRIYEIDRNSTDPNVQAELETNLSLQETYSRLLQIGGFRFQFDEAADTSKGYIPPKKPTTVTWDIPAGSTSTFNPSYQTGTTKKPEEDDDDTE